MDSEASCGNSARSSDGIDAKVLAVFRIGDYIIYSCTGCNIRLKIPGIICVQFSKRGFHLGKTAYSDDGAQISGAIFINQLVAGQHKMQQRLVSSFVTGTSSMLK